MTTRRLWPLALVLLGVLSPAAVHACSRVLSNSNGQSVVVGRTMDLYLDDQAALVLRPRGLEAGGLVSTSVPNAKRWRVKHGSVGVMSVGTVLADGLNERGLNVNLLYLSGSDYGSASSAKPVISNLRMAEFVLDNFANVDQGSYAFQLARNPYPIWVELSRLNFRAGGAMRRLNVQSPALTGDVSELLDRS
ncbi:linear amide C-N hydrolase [Synechococcus sp. A10-1-5-1]|uniref:linear amide C-N hydrolase n=1 Tax=Synechococcus sp. A10-1-5-1 TaxID=2936507 RepID=UPI00200133EA|nr:linear amide C-N hydrolase [Synechococcus sp. A10-1-5-1]UPM50742.1 linear amide C-N hydrolase [Synechococcus sp. A10-1-5-1]